MTYVPVLDLSGLAGAGTPATREFLAGLLTAARRCGFFQVTGHGIPESLTDALMAASRRFFALPLADRLAIENVRSPQFRGYVRLGQEKNAGSPDWREQLDIGLECETPVIGPGDPEYLRLDGPNQWPPALPELRGAVQEWMAACEGVAASLLRALAVALGQPASYFDDEFTGRPRLMAKINRYPGRAAGAAPGEGVNPHRDYGYLTLLFQDMVGGLEFASGTGSFTEIPPQEGGVLVVIGQMLEFASQGILRSPYHRVRSPGPGTDRISAAYFYNPRLDVVVRHMPLSPELSAMAPAATDPGSPATVDYGSHILNGWLASHPEVAARHWAR
jgi:isopenicillin N synthase-like dioxygenase